MTSKSNPIVPFLDLREQYASLAPALDLAVGEVLRSGMYVLGPAVEAFERSFAQYLGASECVCVNSGTAALQLALMGVGLTPGDEVLIPANTFIATAEAVIWAGGRPVLVDVRADDANMDPDALEAAITPRTRGVVPVHLYGRMARIEEIAAIAARHGLFLVEDACQSHGASAGRRRAGTFGAASAFSFYPGKNLGAYGEGGAVVTDDPQVARKARMLRDHGQSRKYEHDLLGHNFRIEGLQGAVLGVKLPHLDDWNARRRTIAGWYRELLSEVPVGLFEQGPVERDVHHLFVIQTDERDALRDYLRSRGIDSLIHYPVPLHRQKALAGRCDGDAFPVTDALAERIVSLPIYPELARDQVHSVCDAISAFHAQRPARVKA